MRLHSNPSFKRSVVSVALGAAAAVAMTGAALAGADDGGTKSFYANPGPGLYTQGPAAGAAAQPGDQSPSSTVQQNSPTATMENGAYQGYRDQPVEPAVRPHRRAVHRHVTTVQ